MDEVEESKNPTENHVFFGVWRLDRIVLKSSTYSDDITKNGDVIPVDVEDYIGYEVEYTSEFFRLGDNKYYNLEYSLNTVEVEEYDESGRFRLTDNFPSLTELIEGEGIMLDGLNEHKCIEDVPLLNFKVTIKDDPYLENPFIPVGTQCVILNEDTMLVGMWGKIILAHRVK